MSNSCTLFVKRHAKYFVPLTSAFVLQHILNAHTKPIIQVVLSAPILSTNSAEAADRTRPQDEHDDGDDEVEGSTESDDSEDEVERSTENDYREDEVECSTATIVAFTALCVALAAATTTTSVDHRLWAIGLTLPIAGLAHAAHDDMSSFHAGWHKSRELAPAATSAATASAGAKATGEPGRLQVTATPAVVVSVDAEGGSPETGTSLHTAAAASSFAAAWMESSCLEDAGAREHRARVTRCRFLEKRRLAALVEQQRNEKRHSSELRRLEWGLHESYGERLRALTSELEISNSRYEAAKSREEALDSQFSQLEAQHRQRLQEINGSYAQDAACRVAAEAAAVARATAAEQAAKSARASFRGATQKVEEAKLSCTNAQRRTCEEALARVQADERVSAAETKEKKLAEQLEQRVTKGATGGLMNDVACQSDEMDGMCDVQRLTDEVTRWRTDCKEHRVLRQGLESNLEELTGKLMRAEKQLKEATQEVKWANAAKMQEHARVSEAVAAMNQVKLEQEQKMATASRRTVMENNARIMIENKSKEILKERDEARNRILQAESEVEAGRKREREQQATLESERTAAKDVEMKLELENRKVLQLLCEQRKIVKQTQTAIIRLETERKCEHNVAPAVTRSKEEESRSLAAQDEKRAGKGRGESDDQEPNFHSLYAALRSKHENLERSHAADKKRSATRCRDLEEMYQVIEGECDIIKSRLIDENKKHEALVEREATQSKLLLEMKKLCQDAKTSGRKISEARETDQRCAKVELKSVKEAYEHRLAKALQREQDQVRSFDAEREELETRMDAEKVARAEAERRAAQALDSLANLKTKKRVGREVGTMTLEHLSAGRHNQNLNPPSPLGVVIPPPEPIGTGIRILPCRAPQADDPGDVSITPTCQRRGENSSSPTCANVDPTTTAATSDISGPSAAGAVGVLDITNNCQRRSVTSNQRNGAGRVPDVITKDTSSGGHEGASHPAQEGDISSAVATVNSDGGCFTGFGTPVIRATACSQKEEEEGISNTVTAAARAGEFLAMLEGGSRSHEELGVREVDLSAVVQLVAGAVCIELHQTQVARTV